MDLGVNATPVSLETENSFRGFFKDTITIGVISPVLSNRLSIPVAQVQFYNVPYFFWVLGCGDSAW